MWGLNMVARILLYPRPAMHGHKCLFFWQTVCAILLGAPLGVPLGRASPYRTWLLAALPRPGLRSRLYFVTAGRTLDFTGGTVWNREKALALGAQDRCGIIAERIDDEEAVKVLTGLKFFGQQIPARSGLRCGYNERVPEGKLIAVLDFPSLFEDHASTTTGRQASKSRTSDRTSCRTFGHWRVTLA